MEAQQRRHLQGPQGPHQPHLSPFLPPWLDPYTPSSGPHLLLLLLPPSPWAPWLTLWEHGYLLFSRQSPIRAHLDCCLCCWLAVCLWPTAEPLWPEEPGESSLPTGHNLVTWQARASEWGSVQLVERGGKRQLAPSLSGRLKGRNWGLSLTLPPFLLVDTALTLPPPSALAAT